MKIPLKILVNDDDETTQKLMCLYLADYENVVTVGCGEEAIKECISNSFDLVIMDIKSRNGTDGVQTLNKIREIERYKSIPVLAVTAFAMKGDKEYFLKEGFDGYMAKPFTKKTLIELIKKYQPIT
jgi:CheY-like chemotaxis protein